MTRKKSIENTFIHYRSQLVNAIKGIVRSSDDIEDIVQETFVKSYEAELKQEIRYERTYMLRTARNLALNHVSKASERHNQSLEDMETLPHSLTSEELEKQVESKERFLNFCRATDTLSVEVKRVFLLKKVYGMSQRDIAQYIGLSESTVEKHVAKGLMQCSLYLKQLTQQNDHNEKHAPSMQGSDSALHMRKK